MKKILLYITALSAISACTPMVWEKSGSTSQDYNKDSYECEKDSRQSGYFGYGLSGQINMQAFFDKCMIAHGWYKRPATNNNAANTQSTPVDPNYGEKLKTAEKYCKKTLSKKAVSDLSKYNNCVSKQLDEANEANKE